VDSGFRLAWRLTSTPGRGTFPKFSLRRFEEPILLPPTGLQSRCPSSSHSALGRWLNCLWKRQKHPADWREWHGYDQSFAVARYHLQPYLRPCYHPRGTISTNIQLKADACMFLLFCFYCFVLQGKDEKTWNCTEGQSYRFCPHVYWCKIGWRLPAKLLHYKKSKNMQAHVPHNEQQVTATSRMSTSYRCWHQQDSDTRELTQNADTSKRSQQPSHLDSSHQV